MISISWAAAATVAVLPLEGDAQEAGIATEGLRDALVVEGWVSLSDTDIEDVLADETTLDQARALHQSGRTALDAGRASDAQRDLAASLALHRDLGSVWLRRTELADVCYLLAVSQSRQGQDPGTQLAMASRLVQDYQPPGRYGLAPVPSQGAAPDVAGLNALGQRLGADAVVVGQLRMGVLQVHWLDDDGVRTVQRPLVAAPYAGDPLYAELLAELGVSGPVASVEAPQPVEFVAVEREDAVQVSPDPPPPAVTAVQPARPPRQPVDRDVVRRRVAYTAIGAVAFGGAAGIAWAVNARGVQGEPTTSRYTVVIETPR